LYTREVKAGHAIGAASDRTEGRPIGEKLQRDRAGVEGADLILNQSVLPDAHRIFAGCHDTVENRPYVENVHLHPEIPKCRAARIDGVRD